MKPKILKSVVISHDPKADQRKPASSWMSWVFAVMGALLSLLPHTSSALQLVIQNNLAKMPKGTGGTLFPYQNCSNDDIWLMWAQSGSPFTVSYGNGTAIPLVNFNNQQSAPVTLSTVIANKGYRISYVNSATLYIACSSSATSPFPTNAAPSPNTATYPFMQVEITSTGSQADVADLTAINYFSFPLSMASYGVGKATPSNRFQSTGFGNNSAATITTALQGGYTGSTPEIRNSSNQIVRILGPSSTYTPSPPFSTGGYSTFNNYLGLLYQQQTAKTNPSSLKLSYTGSGGYTADATVTKSGSGNYGVIINNVVNNGNAISGSIVLNPDTPQSSAASVTIYSGVLHAGGGTVSPSLSALAPTLLASLSAALVTGDAGSTVAFPGSKANPPNNQFRFQNTNSYFTQNSPTAKTNPGLFFNRVQKNSYYDPYFKVISEMCDYSLYGSPYADRFSNWDVTVFTTKYGLPSQPYSQWKPVATLVVTLGPVKPPRSISQADLLIRPDGGEFLGNGVYNKTGKDQTVETSIRKGNYKTYFVKVQNDGDKTNSYILRAETVANPGLSLRYFHDSRDVTDEVTSARGLALNHLLPGELESIKVRLTASEAAESEARLNLSLDVRSDIPSEIADAVKLHATVR